jgi:succinyl-CoA synthetase alpha subunit
MSILIDKKTRLMIQGITGKEGIRACRESLSYGTKVVAGVTPGKGGQKVDGVPVYDTVARALAKHPEINASFITVPGSLAKDAALEAIHAGISLIVILPEHVPTLDSAWIVARARDAGVRVIGPSAIGVISPGKAKIGSIGTGDMTRGFTMGPIGVLSKSGGMTSEICFALTNAGLGQSTAIGMGGDVIAGSSFADMLELFAKDTQTKAIAMFAEVGGTYEEEAAEFIKKKKFRKPVVAIVAGGFGSLLPEDTVLGHAGAIVSRGRGSFASKIKALQSAGVRIARTVEEMPVILRKLL